MAGELDGPRLEPTGGQPAKRLVVFLHGPLASFVPMPGVQAGAAARRCTGFSTIGRLITAESKPNRTDSHHTAS